MEQMCTILQMFIKKKNKKCTYFKKLIFKGNACLCYILCDKLISDLYFYVIFQ